MRKIYYQIDGDEKEFFSLRDAKHHVFLAYTPDERIKYLKGSGIYKYVDGEIVNETEIIVDDAGNYRFSRTIKL